MPAVLPMGRYRYRPGSAWRYTVTRPSGGKAGVSVQAAITSAVPVVSVTVPGSVAPAASAAAVWSMAPAATGMPSGSPSNAAASLRSGPAFSPHGMHAGSNRTEIPAASSASGQ